MQQMYTREEFAAKLGANGDPKLIAAADFVARLLSGPAGDRVARIILFGSVARGAARPESDVDVLVFSASDVESVRNAANEAALEAGAAWNQSVEPLTFSLSDLRVPTSWFVYRTLQIGREVYRMDEKMLRYQEALGGLELAREYLAQAEAAGQLRHYRLAVDGAYNAAELAVKGALVLRVKDLPTTHGGLLQIFGREYVATNVAERRYSTRLGQALQLWNTARHVRAADIAEDHVRHVTDVARDLMRFLSDQLKQVEARTGSANAADG